MSRRRAPQGAQVIAALKGRYQAPVAAVVGDTGYLGGGPSVIVLMEVQHGQRVVGVGVGAGRNQNEVRRERAQCRQDRTGHGGAELSATVARRQGHVDDVADPLLVSRAAAGVVGVLVGRAEKQITVGLEHMLGTVAVVDVEIDHCHTAKPVDCPYLGGGDRHVVEQAESHGPSVFRMVARRAHGAKSVLPVAGHHSIDGGADTACRPQCRLARTRRHNRIRFESQPTLDWRGVEHMAHIIRLMHAFDLGNLREGRLVPLQRFEFAGAQGGKHGPQAIRPFRMPGAGIVFDTGRMGEQQRGHGGPRRGFGGVFHISTHGARYRIIAMAPRKPPVYGPVAMTYRHFIFAVALFAAAFTVTPQTLAQDDATLVQVDTVVQEPLTQKFTVIGRLVARQHGEVAARISGPLAEMRVHIGDRVGKDDIIAVIDRLRPTLRRDIAAAEVAASNAGLATAEARYAMALAGVGQAEAQLTQARQELVRIEKLRNSTAFSPARYDDQQQLVAAANSEVDFAQATVQEAQSLIEQGRAAILRARATLKIANDDLRHTEVRAPFDGVVTLRHTEVGAFVEIGSRVITLINDRDIEIEADVPFERLGGLAPGVEITFLLDDDVPHTAAVRAIGVEENSRTRTRPVRFTPLFGGDAGSLADGQSVTIDLPIGPPRDVVSVHKDAIVRNVTGAAVFVVIDGIAEHRLVSLGEAIGARFEVLDGVAPGDVVVVRGNERLMPGQAVQFEGDT